MCLDSHCRTSSLVASTAGAVVEPEKGKFPIWPEWNEADINAEKWEGAKVSKDRDKSGKSPSLVSKSKLHLTISVSLAL